MDYWVGKGEKNKIEKGKIGNEIGKKKMEKIEENEGIEKKEIMKKI